MKLRPAIQARLAREKFFILFPSGVREETAKKQVDALRNGLARRQAQWQAPPPAMSSGYWKLYIDHVLQADEGADLDFLRGMRGAAVPKDNH